MYIYFSKQSSDCTKENAALYNYLTFNRAILFAWLQSLCKCHIGACVISCGVCAVNELSDDGVPLDAEMSKCIVCCLYICIVHMSLNLPWQVRELCYWLLSCML